MRYREDQSGLIAALFDAASGATPDWTGFLSLLAAMTRADGAALTTAAGALGRHGTGPELGPETRQRMRSDRIYSGDTLPAASADAPLRALKVRITREDHAVLQIARAPHARDFRSADALFLDGLVPFLGQAVAIWRAGVSARRAAALTERLAAGLGAGWLLLDRGGTILDLSPFAARWGQSAGLHLAEHRRLEPADPDAARALRRGLATCADGTGPVTVALGTLPRAELVLHPDSPDGSPVILGLLRVEPQAVALPVDETAAHLGLSRSEARLAMALADGHGLRAAAERLGWTEDTARSTSKQVYARLGVTGQTGLLRRVLNGALWLR